MYVGRRIETPVTLPARSRRTEAIAFAAPVVVGRMFPKTVACQTARQLNILALTPRAMGCAGQTESGIPFVVAIQDILTLPRSMHSRQQALLNPETVMNNFQHWRDAVCRTACAELTSSAVLKASALTPTTYVGESAMGADMITRLAGRYVMCSKAGAHFVNLPVLSTTYSTPNCSQFTFLGSCSEIRLIY